MAPMEPSLSARSRRAPREEENDTSRCNGNGWTLLCALTSVVFALCSAYMYQQWTPIDRHNIGNVPADAYLSYGPIDVVYTWVNGTDPRWKAEKEYWHKHWIASLTGQPLPKKREDTKNVKGKDVSNSDNRFRDNEELRYSLRSLEKYAPWIRHVYIVTDGQIPSWLDIECPKVTIIKHRDIFANTSHLPVFSSPAIEWNLDRIPGLSETFLYFNDDVFLGSYVHPEDFISPKGVQKVYLAWEIPLCSQGCWDSWLQNGRCDKECNVTACDFDMGDCGCDVDPNDGTVSCDPIKVASIQETAPKPPKIADHLCQGACHYRWLGDQACDVSCNISSCGFDGGDCGVQLIKDYVYSATLVPPIERPEEEGDEEKEQTVVQVPLLVNSTYLNLTQVFSMNGSIVSATHDNEQLIRHATVFESDMLLLLVLGRDAEGDPMTSSANVVVEGRTVNGTSMQVSFALVRGYKSIASAQQENEEDLKSAGYFTYKNLTIKPRLVRLPFGFRFANFSMTTPRPITQNEQKTTAAPTEEEKQAKEEEQDKENKEEDKEPPLPLLEIRLPFNVTGRRLKHGEIMVVDMDANFRLHDDQDGDDYYAVAAQSCQVLIPQEYSSKGIGMIEQKKKVQKSSAVGTRRTIDKPETVTAETTETTTVEAATAATDSAASKAADFTGSSSDAVVSVPMEAVETVSTTKKLEVETPVPSYRPDIPVCELLPAQQGAGIVMRVYLPTHATRPPPTSSKPGDESNTPSAASFDPVPQEEETPEAADMDTSLRPQIVDGSICLSDAEESVRKYCFDIAVGNFYAHHTVTTFTPPPVIPRKPTVAYQPYLGDDREVLIELETTCIDTTRRLIGMRRRQCYAQEVPHPVVVEATKKEAQKKDPKQQNLEEGRRLACAAKKRRLEAQEAEREAEEAADGAMDGSVVGFLHRVHAVMNQKLGLVQRYLGLEMLEETLEDIEDAEYEDVCQPFLQEEAAQKHPPVSAAAAEALLSKDTFGDSLRYANKLYNRVFGKASSRRRVPSHMPFLLQKKLIGEIKARWPQEYDATSSHRFRHPQDFQFSFSYFHYLMNRYKIQPPTLAFVWKEYLDANRNGILDPNEVLTVASLAYGDYPTDAYVDQVKACLQPPKQEKVMEKSTAKGNVLVAETLTPHITFEHLEACTDITEKLIANVRKEKLYELMPEDEVTFHMLSDQYRYAWNQMLGTRARRTKFVCINDDMKYPNPQVSQILHELFLSIWPKRSQFELPYHLKNRYAHIDEYNEAMARRQLSMAVALAVVLGLMAFFGAELKALFGFQDIARARAASASQLTAEMERQQQQEAQKDQ